MNSFDMDAKYLSNMYLRMSEFIFGKETTESAKTSLTNAGAQAATHASSAQATSFTTAEAKNSLTAPTGSATAGAYGGMNLFTTMLALAGAPGLAALAVQSLLSFMDGESSAAEEAPKAPGAAEKHASHYRDPFSTIDCYGDKVY